ncbi:MAG: hypothetical protein Q4G68_11065 [Planctomycetia bacterium]|nr:hypothetical protein [Planctomycetia bacterium]
MKKTIYYSFLFAFSLCLLCCGCKKNMPDGMPRLYRVALTLTQESKPLAEANVNLVAVDQPEISRFGIGGRTDELGNVSLTTRGQYEGVPEGKYKVLVTKNEVIGLQAPPELMFKELEQWNAEHKSELAKTKYVSRVDSVYANVKSTPLEITVVKGKNAFTLDCGKAVETELKAR